MQPLLAPAAWLVSIFILLTLMRRPGWRMAIPIVATGPLGRWIAPIHPGDEEQPETDRAPSTQGHGTPVLLAAVLGLAIARVAAFAMLHG